MDGVSAAGGVGAEVQMALLRKVLDMAGSQVLPLLEATPTAQAAGNPPHLGQQVDART